MHHLHLALLAAIVAGIQATAFPNPNPNPSPSSKGAQIANIGPCPKDCWNEAAGLVGCDPENDKKCLCGVFFDEVTTCVSQACSITDNLGMWMMMLLAVLYLLSLPVPSPVHYYSDYIPTVVLGDHHHDVHVADDERDKTRHDTLRQEQAANECTTIAALDFLEPACG